jgi:hypothetical protein
MEKLPVRKRELEFIMMACSLIFEKGCLFDHPEN